jgi:hypothetical protein
MENIIKRCGRFTLMQTEEGYCWCLTTRGGRQWHWHPDTRQWTSSRQFSPTEAEATVELDWTLDHEDVGDLDEQHHHS